MPTVDMIVIPIYKKKICNARLVSFLYSKEMFHFLSKNKKEYSCRQSLKNLSHT